jgi:hypothetical protein
VATAASDELHSGVGAAVGIGVWAAGCGLVALGLFLVGRIRAQIDAPCGRPAGVLWTVLPFVAVFGVLYLASMPVVAAWNARPSKVEAAVEREWQGRQLTVPLGLGIGGSDPEMATAPVSAKDVSCEETAADVDGAPVFACTVVHCDVDRASFFDCPDTTSPACAALSGNELVLISGTWGTGPSRLRDQLHRVPECAF